MSYMPIEKTPVPPPKCEQVQPPATVVVMTQPLVGSDPTPMTCPHCHSQVTSVVENKTTTKTHLICLLLCLVGCCCCAPLVYFTDSCMAKKHTCPNCNHFLGVYDS